MKYHTEVIIVRKDGASESRGTIEAGSLADAVNLAAEELFHETIDEATDYPIVVRVWPHEQSVEQAIRKLKTVCACDVTSEEK